MLTSRPDRPLSFSANFLWNQFKPLPVPATDFSGKTIIVTGANSGLGLEASRHFVRLGAAKVILGCRSAEKAEVAKADIEITTGRKDVVEVWPLEMGSFDSVREFCRRAATLDRLDVVIENAALAMGVFEELEGFESSVTVNVVSTFLMALLLLPTLRRTASKHNVQTHLSIVSSDAHYFVSNCLFNTQWVFRRPRQPNSCIKARFKERQSPSIFEAFRSEADMTEDRYNTTKLIVVFIVRELAHAMARSRPGNEDTPVIVNVINPGYCRTQLFRHASPPLSWIIATGLLLFGRTGEMGSRTLVGGAEADQGSHGSYLDSCKVRDPAPMVLNPEGAKTQKRVFAELMEVLEGIEPGITKNI